MKPLKLFFILAQTLSLIPLTTGCANWFTANSPVAYYPNHSGAYASQPFYSGAASGNRSYYDPYQYDGYNGRNCQNSSRIRHPVIERPVSAAEITQRAAARELEAKAQITQQNFRNEAKINQVAMETKNRLNQMEATRNFALAQQQQALQNQQAAAQVQASQLTAELNRRQAQAQTAAQSTEAMQNFALARQQQALQAQQAIAQVQASQIAARANLQQAQWAAANQRNESIRAFSAALQQQQAQTAIQQQANQIQTSLQRYTPAPSPILSTSGQNSSSSSSATSSSNNDAKKKWEEAVHNMQVLQRLMHH